VQEVLQKRRDGELGAVGPPTDTTQLLRCEPVDLVDEALGNSLELGGDDFGILLPVTLGDRSLVLVPVGKGRIVLGQHQLEPALEHPKHISHVRAVLQRRPDIGPRPLRDRRAGVQDLHPLLGGDEGSGAHLVGAEIARGQSTLLAAAGQRPGPVLDVRFRLHAVTLLPQPCPQPEGTSCGEVDHFGA
jgi:hypothetical protein